MVFIASTVGLMCCFYLSKFIYTPILALFTGTEGQYFKMSKKTQAEYHSRNVSDIHSYIAFPLAFYSTFYACESPEQNIFNSDVCLSTPKRVQLYLVAFSSGYCLYDLIICFVEIKYTWKEGADFIIHHLVGMGGAIAVLVAGDFTVGLSTGQLVSEFSNAMMNMRWRLLKHKLTEHWTYLPANFAFFFAYLCCRIVFMGALLVRTYEMSMKTSLYSHPNPFVVASTWIAVGFQVMLYMIQVYWFYLICIAMQRAIMGKSTKDLETDL